MNTTIFIKNNAILISQSDVYPSRKELNTTEHRFRSPTPLTDQLQDAKDKEFQNEIEIFVYLLVNNLPAFDKFLKEIHQQ